MKVDKCLENNYTDFYNKRKQIDLEELKSGLSDSDIDSLEKKLDTKLPNSYKEFLKCCGGFWAFGGSVQLDSQHPFKHDFKPFDSLTVQQQKIVKQRGGIWPPPSNGMICFGEFFMVADGDQVLFDISKGLVNGEYPIYYYSHETNPPTVRKIANNFEQWLTEFPDYEEFEIED